jgi:hypothetical protein
MGWLSPGSVSDTIQNTIDIYDSEHACDDHICRSLDVSTVDRASNVIAALKST